MGIETTDKSEIKSNYLPVLHSRLKNIHRPVSGPTPEITPKTLKINQFTGFIYLAASGDFYSLEESHPSPTH